MLGYRLFQDKGNIADIQYALVLCAVMLCATLGIAIPIKHAEKKALQKLEQRNATRGQEFADYIFDGIKSDVNAYVLQHKPTRADILYSTDDLIDREIQYLVKDSTKYADAIVRDASEVISKLDETYIVRQQMPYEKKPTIKPWASEKTFRAVLKKYGNNYTPFDQALKHVQNQQTLIMGPEYRWDYEYAEDENGLPLVISTPVPTGKEIVKGSNISADYKMKVNIRHLEGISKNLAYYRALKAQKIRNLQKRGK